MNLKEYASVIYIVLLYVSEFKQNFVHSFSMLVYTSVTYAIEIQSKVTSVRDYPDLSSQSICTNLVQTQVPEASRWRLIPLRHGIIKIIGRTSVLQFCV